MYAIGRDGRFAKIENGIMTCFGYIRENGEIVFNTIVVVNKETPVLVSGRAIFYRETDLEELKVDKMDLSWVTEYREEL